MPSRLGHSYTKTALSSVVSMLLARALSRSGAASRALTTSVSRHLHPASICTTTIARAIEGDDTHAILVAANEAFATVDASANAALLEDDPSNRKSLDHYRARYLEFARDSLLLAIARANSLQSQGTLDEAAAVELVLCRAALDNADAALETLGMLGPGRR